VTGEPTAVGLPRAEGAGRLPLAQAAVDRLIACLAAALNIRALYPPAHPSMAAALARLQEGVVAVCDDRRQDAVTFVRLDDELVVDGHPLRSGALYLQPFVRALERSRVARLTVARAVELDECQALVDALATGGHPRSTAHVVVGQVEIVAPGAADPTGPAAPGADAGDGASVAVAAAGGGSQGGALAPSAIAAALDLFCRVRHEGVTDLDPIEEVVWGLANAVARSTQAVLPAVPLKTYDEYTFVHSVNVSLLVLAQARGFGFEGPLLHTMGVAALLHDVGKLKVPLEVLNKAGKLLDEEWRIMMGHAERGAWELARLARSAPLAILVAYEHHLRYDGQPNYPPLRVPRIPTLASQLTAIADVYDAICTVRPYRRALTRAAALDVLRTRAGTFHDPYLVGQFCRLVAPD
jgi:HD-GYP domain-containing protein (c-di-GMP phosphodiesterase class II)